MRSFIVKFDLLYRIQNKFKIGRGTEDGEKQKESLLKNLSSCKTTIARFWDSCYAITFKNIFLAPRPEEDIRNRDWGAMPLPQYGIGGMPRRKIIGGQESRQKSWKNREISST